MYLLGVVMMFSLYRGLSYIGSGALGVCSVWGVWLCLFVCLCLVVFCVVSAGGMDSLIGVVPG